MMIRVLVALGGAFILLLNLFFDKGTRHRHEYKKVLYYTITGDEIKLYKEYRCSCGKYKNYEYITTLYCYTMLKAQSELKRLKTLGYVSKEELEADLIAPLDWIKEE